MKPKHLILISFYILSIEFIGNCQSNENRTETQLDSLKKELHRVQSDSVREQILYKIISNYYRLNTDSAIYYGNKMQDLADKLSNPRISLRVSGFIADTYHTFGNLPKAMEICLNAIALGESLHQQLEILGPTYSSLGDIYIELGEYRKALNAYGKLDKSWLGAAFAHYGRANVYVKMNKLDSAWTELSLSEKRFKENRNTDDQTQWIYPINPNWYNTRATIYFKLGKLDAARADIYTSLRMALKTGDSYYIANSYNDLAILYDSLNMPDSAVFYAGKGLEEGNKISYTGGILIASEILSRLYDGVDDTEALRYLKLANDSRNQLYGAGNIQVMKDMIAQNEKRQQEIENAEKTYQNKLRTNILLAVAAILVITTALLFWNTRQKQKSKNKIEEAYKRLKNTQSQLIQSEKMASLGELTAGIAHEIQNPLNFVNNFSEVSNELIDELESELAAGNLQLATAIAHDISNNLEKINHHGKRADGIVKGMLQHSRTSSGQKELTDINVLCDEYLRLSYHGYRAKDKSFNAKFQLDLDPSLPKIEVVPQDIGRVVLNLINNAFYAVNERSNLRTGRAGNQKLTTKNNSYDPQVTVSTKNLSNKIEIIVKDNGPGIPDSIKEKIFQPFFTTKQTGQGTGLGLSLSYDIAKAHNGNIEVQSNDDGAIFILTLPIL